MFEFRGTDPHTIMTSESRYAPVGKGYQVLLDVNEKTKYGETVLKMDYQLALHLKDSWWEESVQLDLPV